MSDWVQREVDTARAAQISILPYHINPDADPDKIKKALERLGLEKVQHLAYGNAPNFAVLDERIVKLALDTRENQQKRIQALKEKWQSAARPNIEKTSPERPKMSIAPAYKLRGLDHPVRIHLANGGIQQMRGIDVLVNTENDYLQMSRAHERHTVSAQLRYCGSLMENGLITEDSVQLELDAQVNFSNTGARPVKLGQVIATNAGHPLSDLRKPHPKTGKRNRFIFHAITVSMFPEFSKEVMTPISDNNGIRTCTRRVLEKVIEVDRKRGVISATDFFTPLGRNPHDEEIALRDEYHPIDSIVFPIFGTGHAGRGIPDVLPWMLEGIARFFEDNEDMITLKDIHICVFFEQDVPMVRQQMERVFDPVS
jgi:hypothetical protein